jgi:hypothetical protein
VVGVDQQDHVGLANLSGQVVSFLRESGGVDDSGSSDIFGGADGRRDGDLR